MANLISTDEARQHLRLDSDSAGGSDDAWLLVWIAAASEAVRLWLKDDWRQFEWTYDSNDDLILDSNGDPIPQTDSNGDEIVRAVVKAAVLIELSSLYRFREGEGDNAVPPDAGHGYTLNKTSTALLAGLRKTTIS